MSQSYSYRARNKENKIVTGVVQASGLDAAKKILLQNDLTPLSISTPKSFADFLPFVNKVSLKDRTMFARQISTMIEAGLTLSQSIRLLIQQMKKGKFRLVMEGVLNDIQDGFSFSTALSKYPEVFDQIFVNVVRSGETTGKLEVVLAQLSTNMENEVKVRSKIKGALMYPAFVVTAMAGMAAIMMVKVIPQITSVFSESKMELPLSTKLLIGISTFMANYWPWLIVGIIAALMFLRWFFRTQAGIDLLSKYSLKIPVAGTIIEQSSMARLGRLLSMLLASGVPLLEGLRLITDSFPNALYKRGLIEIAAQVERGVPMSVPITENPVFPLMVGQMVAVGEQTGKMDEIMARMAEYYDDEVESKVAGLSSLIEPIIIVILGIGVAWLVIAVLLPIYQISTTAG